MNLKKKKYVDIFGLMKKKAFNDTLSLYRILNI